MSNPAELPPLPTPRFDSFDRFGELERLLRDDAAARLARVLGAISAYAGRPQGRLAAWFWGLLGAIVAAFGSLALWSVVDSLLQSSPLLATLLGILLAAFGNDDVGMTSGRLDKLIVHWPNGSEILSDNRFCRSPPLCNITLEPANRTDVVRRIDVNTDVEQIENPRFGEDQDAFDNDYRLGLDQFDLVTACVRFEIIERHLDRQILLQPPQMIDKHVAVDRIRMVKICLMTFIKRHVGEVSVIRILLDQNYFFSADRSNDRPRDRCFSRASSAANTNYHLTLKMILLNSSLKTSATFAPVSITSS